VSPEQNWSTRPNCWIKAAIWIADAHRGDGRRYVVRADEKLTEFLELEAAIRAVSWDCA